jgi:hypothetical protein
MIKTTWTVLALTGAIMVSAEARAAPLLGCFARNYCRVHLAQHPIKRNSGEVKNISESIRP